MIGIFFTKDGYRCVKPNKPPNPEMSRQIGLTLHKFVELMSFTKKF